MTISKEQNVATKSANVTPTPIVGMRCMLWLTGVRIFIRLGRDPPALIKLTPTSPFGDSTLAYAKPGVSGHPSLAPRKWVIRDSMPVNFPKLEMGSSHCHPPTPRLPADWRLNTAADPWSLKPGLTAAQPNWPKADDARDCTTLNPRPYGDNSTTRGC